MTQYTLLGPHPGGQMYSISKYFNFYRTRLPAILGDQVLGKCPGFIEELSHGTLPTMPRRQAWWQNYVLWPLELRRQKADCFHIVDQGLLWYARFLRKSRIIATVHDLIAYMIRSGKLDLQQPPAKRNFVIAESIRRDGGVQIYLKFEGYPRFPLSPVQTTQLSALLQQCRKNLDAVKSGN